MGLNLNAGCGANTWGDIRVDIQTFSDVYYNKKTSANIISSIQFLPFRDHVFSKVICYHVLEHVKKPFKCVAELKRVTKGRIIIRVPFNSLISFVADSITLLKAFMMLPLIGSEYFKDTFFKVRHFNKRHSGHRWMIKGSKTNYVYWILPIEYETIIDMRVSL